MADDNNIARYAEIKTIPPVKYRATNTIVDGNPDTGASFRRGVTMGGIYEFIYKNPVVVTKIRFFQGLNRRFENSDLCASEYVIMADTANKGEYDTTIVRSTTGVAGWNEHAFPPVKVYRIMFKALKGKGPWEESYPFISEFEIYSSDKFLPPLEERSEKRAAVQDSMEKADSILDTGTEAIEITFSERDKNAFIKGVVVAFWNFGLQPEMKEDKFNFKNMKIQDAPKFKEFIDKLKSIDANTVCLMREEKDALACWPSKNFKTTSPDRDFLQEFCDAMHANGFKVHVNMIAAAVSNCLQDIKPDDYSLTHQKALKEKWILLLKEVAARSVDGLYVCPDEIFFGSYNMSKLPEGHPVSRNFMAKYKQAPPAPQPGLLKMDIFRKQCLFNYEQTSLLIKQWNDCVKDVNPAVVTLTNLGPHPFAYNNRLLYNFSYDIVGSLSGVDYLGTDYQNAKTRFLVTAASGKTKAVMAVFPSARQDNLSCILQGARGITVYRYNYIFTENKTDSTKATFFLCDTLANWGYDGTLRPAKIVLLASRASEDWWQLDNNSIHRADEKTIESKMGFWSTEIIAEFLDLGGYPYDVLYLDREEDLKKVAEYPLAVMPFPYSVSKKAAAILGKAFDGKTRFLIFGKKGEVDEYGMKHAAGPVLNRIITDGALNKKSLFLDLAPVEYERKSGYETCLSDKINLLLGRDKDFYFDRKGREVVVYFLNKNDQDRLIVLNNKENRNALVSVGFHMPQGVYSIRSTSNTNPGKMYSCSLSGKQKIDAEELAVFAVELKPDETKLIRIVPDL
ncbi:MAG: hypothetical protein WCI51_11465 [Lentisphaerota bacterium]